VAKKRQQGNGSGTVYPRKNKDGKVTSYLGSYFAPDGKRRYVSAKTKTACREKLRRAMSDADQGFVFDAGKQSVGGYMVRWLEDFAKADLAPRTYHNYKLQIREHIVPAFGTMEALQARHAQHPGSLLCQTQERPQALERPLHTRRTAPRLKQSSRAETDSP
jgi:integrase